MQMLSTSCSLSPSMSAGLRDKVGAELRSFLLGRKEQSMEDAMYLPGQREVKAVGVRKDNLRDLEGAFSMRGQFLGGKVDLQVLEI